MKKSSIIQRDRSFFGSFALAIAVCTVFLLNSCKNNPKPSIQPNIVFIFSDDHATQAISAYGGRLANVAPTPNIDRLANEGMRFDKCYVTNSICAPSRATILTGKHSHINGVIDNVTEFDGSQQTFPKLLQQAGYQTALVGKWHLKSDPTGFDYWNILPGQGQYYNPEFIEIGNEKRIEGYVTDVTTDIALEWMEKRDKEKPFCLMIQQKAPHRNWMPGPEKLTLFDEVDIPMPDNFFDNYENRSSAASTQEMEIDKFMWWGHDFKLPQWMIDELGGNFDEWAKEAWKNDNARFSAEQKAIWDSAYNPKNERFFKSHLEGKELAKWKYQRYIKDYLRCIASVDENVGRVQDYLEANGLKENTIIIYSSDQGFFLGEHGWFDKRFMYEESFRTPLIASWPGQIKEGSVNTDLVSNLDFAQTFLDIAGADQPEDMQGSSLKPLMLGNAPENWRKSVYYHYYEFPKWCSIQPHEGVSNAHHKLIYFYKIDEWELFDLERDPNEMKNEYSNPEYSSIVSKMKNELAQLRKEYMVPPLETDYK